MERNFSNQMQNSLIWLPEQGWGYLKPNKNFIYEEKYIEKFRQYEGTEKTRALNHLRVATVNFYIQNDWVLDYGCGAGTFIKSRGGETFGYDISLGVLDWLKEKSLYYDPNSSTLLENVCFWDSLEHIEDPTFLLGQIYNHAFISMPVYKSGEDVLKSKHYKPNEHIWYFTIDGLIKFMAHHHFECLYHGNIEEQIGREEIETFVFKKRK